MQNIYQVVLLCISIQFSQSIDNYHSTKSLIDNLLFNYSTSISPQKNQSQPVTVTVRPFINLILDFNEATGTFSIFGTFMISWTDELIIWNNSQYNLSQILLPLRDVWVPRLLLKNSAKRRTFYSYDNDFDYNTARVRYQANGSAYFDVGGVIDTSCDADMYFYPADHQLCSIKFYPENSGIRFDTDSLTDLRQWALMWYEENAEWELYNVTSALNDDIIYLPILSFHIHMKRKPLFICVSLVLPICLVSFINILAFLLPIESGERISFSVTLFLTFVIVMTMVADSLPPTSQIGLFTMYLIKKLVTSTLITTVVIVTVHLFHKEGQDPDHCKQQSQEASPCNQIVTPDKVSRSVKGTEFCILEKVSLSHKWKYVAKRIDKLCVTVLVVDLVIECVFAAVIFMTR